MHYNSELIIFEALICNTQYVLKTFVISETPTAGFYFIQILSLKIIFSFVLIKTEGPLKITLSDYISELH